MSISFQLMRRLVVATLAICLVTALPPLAFALEVVDDWRFTTSQPTDQWYTASYDDSEWKEATAGLGSHGTPNARIGVEWTSQAIWLRKVYDFESAPSQPSLLIHHDEDVQVYLNGGLVADLKGYSNDYAVVPIPANKKFLCRDGKNVLAVYCRQTDGGQFIDVHLIQDSIVPDLPQPKRELHKSDLMTRWGEELTPDNAWTEYPRPQFQRADWTNLNGEWDYAITRAHQQAAPKDWTGKILAPFCLESKLGGVQEPLGADEALWYQRTFEARKETGKRRLLNFEAVDYRCQVYVNGRSVGEHQGGNTPFSFDITDALQEGDNELLVRVEDDTEKFQLRGKQTFNPNGIWYTQVSGIWQTVWTEVVSASHLKDLKIQTDAATGSITVRPTIAGSGVVTIVVKDGDQQVASGTTSGDELTLLIPNAKLWSPDSPHLYEIEAVLSTNGKQVDRVKSYAGIRTVGRTVDADGNWRFTLNGKPIFHWGPLDQGWWPDGLLTPPADKAMQFEIEWLKQAGFNMIRKHIKVEPRRYYYHCDRLGMMVWQDQVSGGASPRWTFLRPNPNDAIWPDEQHDQFMLELEWMIDSLENHPSIVVWVPFNECWGQHRTEEVGKWVVQRDPSRLVNVASGGNFWPVGHVVDKHEYPHPGFPFDQNTNGRFDDFIKVVGEFGGHGYPVRGHLWKVSERNWGYGGLPKNKAELKQRYATSIKLLNELRAKGISGGVYTQTTDVEGEINGLMTYDRKVIKLSAEELAELHSMLFE